MMRFTILVAYFAFGALCEVKGDCGPPPVIPNSLSNATESIFNLPHFAVILYRCENHYIPRGNPIVTCRNGVWVHAGRNFECNLRECGYLEIRHGTVTLDSYTVGSVARFTCDAGYQIHGSSISLCLTSGNWDPEAPTCDVTFCPELPPVEHLSRFQANENGEFNDYTSVVTNRCDFGYLLVGDTETVCQADGTWSGTPAHCERIECNSPNIGGGTVLSMTHPYFGGVALIRCFEGYTLVGDDAIICDETGWSEGYCYGNCTVEQITNGHSEDTVLREGEVLRWGCDSSNGFIKYPGERDTLCHNGTLMPPPECRLIEFGPDGCRSESADERVTRVGSMCYVMTSYRLQYDRAEEFCSLTYHGRLLTVQNQSKMDYIASILSNTDYQTDCSGWFDSCTKVWLGLYYNDTWRWPALTDEIATYTNWLPGEGGLTLGMKFERCAVLDGENGWLWNDEDCDDDYNLVCEIHAQTEM